MRVPIAQAGSVRKMFDFRCDKCSRIWEDMANQTEIDSKSIKCPGCDGAGTKLISAVGIDSHAAAAWRR